jgi:polar amino acid transport system substrate-binding protein
MPTGKFIFFFMICILGQVSSAETETSLVIVTGEIPPAVSEDPSQSFLTAVFHAVEQEMGVSFVFKFLPWKRCELAVETLDAWGAIPYVRTQGREKKFYFSDRLFKNTSKLFGYSTDDTMRNLSFEDLSELKHYRIGGVRGYWYEQVFQEAGIKLELVSEEKQNIIKLQGTRIDFTPVDESAGWYMINKMFPQKKDAFYTLTKPLRENEIFLMTSKQYPETQQLLNRFNIAMKEIKENGTFQQLMDEYGVIYIP